MALVGPTVKSRMMKQAMGYVKEAILQKQYKQITHTDVPPSIGTRLIIDSRLAMKVQLNRHCHRQGEDSSRNNR